MSKRAKTISRMRQNPKNVRYDDICHLLESLGFKARRKGSHTWYTHRNCPSPIGIRYDYPVIGCEYVKTALRILDEAGFLDDDNDSDESDE